MTKTIWAVVGVSVAATVAMAVALAIVLAGGDDDPDPESPAAPFAVGSGPASSGAAPEELEDFRECLEDQGVELPTPGEEPPANSDELQDAVESCQEYLPEGAQFRFGPSEAPVPQN
jgi:hypothetical protein